MLQTNTVVDVMIRCDNLLQCNLLLRFSYFGRKKGETQILRYAKFWLTVVVQDLNEIIAGVGCMMR
jgi:hypothetical protein